MERKGTQDLTTSHGPARGEIRTLQYERLIRACRTRLGRSLQCPDCANAVRAQIVLRRQADAATGRRDPCFQRARRVNLANQNGGSLVIERTRWRRMRSPFERKTAHDGAVAGHVSVVSPTRPHAIRVQANATDAKHRPNRSSWRQCP